MNEGNENIFDLARKKIGPSLIQSFFSSAGSYISNGEYFILSPLRNDNKIGSFSINLESGLFNDFATGQKGDFIDLVSETRSISKLYAAGLIAGVGVPKNEIKSVKKAKTDKPIPIIPIPETAEIKKLLNEKMVHFYRTKQSDNNKFYPYRDIDGNLMYGVLRYEGKSGKGFTCVYMDIENNVVFRKPDLKVYYPYRIETIKDNDLPVLIVEGEKCANCNVDGYNVISWLGGTSSVSKTDWSLLEDREVYIWPDADSLADKSTGNVVNKNKQPGLKAALEIKAVLNKAHILDIYQYKPIDGNPNGWDLADCIQGGIDPLYVIKECLPKDEIIVELDGKEVFNMFVKMFYDGNNLEQNGGVYWIYHKDKHYWKTAEKKDIICNMQRWMEETELHYLVKAKTKTTAFFNDMKSFLDSHSRGFIYENPFKDSATSPYLHVKNGAIKVTQEGSEFITRKEMGEDYFKDLFPVNCLDFDFLPNHIDNVDLEKDCPSFNFFLEEVFPADLRRNYDKKKLAEEVEKTKIMFAQVLAYSLVPLKPIEYNFGLLGNQRAGKSFFIKIVKSLVGSEFCVERRIADMDSRFASSDLWGKKVFIEPDMKARQLLPDDFIKAYAGQQEITIERKNENPISGVKTSLALFFVSNYDFSVKGTEGVERRFIIINFKNKIDKPDVMLLDKILGKAKKGKESGHTEGKQFDERSAMLGFAMLGWKKFIEDDFAFTLPEWVINDKSKWMEESNSVSNFMYETYLHKGEETSIERGELYRQYKEWCENEGAMPMGKKNCFSEIRRLPGVLEIESARVFKIKKVYIDEIPF